MNALIGIVIGVLVVQVVAQALRLNRLDDTVRVLLREVARLNEAAQIERLGG